MPKKSSPFQTSPPRITPKQIATIKAAAARHLLSGGAVLREAEAGDDRSEHIANVRELIWPGTTDVRDNLLSDRLRGSDSDIENAINEAEAATSEAGYLFGVAVGMKLANLVLDPFAPAEKPARKQARRR